MVTLTYPNGVIQVIKPHSRLFEFTHDNVRALADTVSEGKPYKLDYERT